MDQQAKGGRSRYLLDGRRVKIGDLVEHGKLRPGDRLKFTRPRKGEQHVATVDESGLQLDDGRHFATPSTAARAAMGAGQIDGWTAWVTEPGGVTLSMLRSQLLDDLVSAPEAALAGVDDPSEEYHAEQASFSLGSPNAAARHEFLKEARRVAVGGQPTNDTVRGLLSRWGGLARGARINERIIADLDNHGLVTAPDFRHVTLNTRVGIVAAEPEEEDKDTSVPSSIVDLQEGVEVVQDTRLTLGNLPSALSSVVSVKPQATLDQAMTHMQLNDYSQLPVLSGPRECRGAVTWSSIAMAQHVDAAATLADATIRAQPMPYDTPLVDVLPRLAAEDFIIVLDHTRAISGIVTTADVVNLYGDLATPFLLIGELDQELRQLVNRFPIERVSKICDPAGTRQLESYDDLAMGDYERVLQHPECWSEIGWPIDRVLFSDRLMELREIRNDVMHFNPDPVPDGAVPKLRNILSLVRRYRESVV